MTPNVLRRAGQLVRTLAVVVTGAMAGCQAGGPATGPPSDAEQISTIVSYASGAYTEPERFESYFVEGAAPDASQRQRLNGVMCIADAENVSISGDSATAEVRFLDGNDSHELGRAQWKLQRVNGEWKLTAIAFPEGVAAG